MLAGGGEDGFFRMLYFRGCSGNWTMHYRTLPAIRTHHLSVPFGHANNWSCTKYNQFLDINIATFEIESKNVPIQALGTM